MGLQITRVSRLWRREMDKASAKHGLSQATALPLIVLSRRGKSVRQNDLANEVGIEGPSLVRLIDLLETEGLVARREDPTDRRAKMVHLTALGEKRASELEGTLRRIRAYLLKSISGDDLAVTFGVLQKIEERANLLLKAGLEKSRP